MKQRWKIIAALALVIAAVVAGVMFLAARPDAPVPGAILMPDGMMVHLEAVTYGTNHLVGPRLSHVAKHLPFTGQIWMRRIFGARASMRFSATTDSPKLVLWLNRGIMAGAFPTNLGYSECLLADQNGFLAGPPVHYGPTYPLEVMEFSAFPRRDPQFVLNIYHHDATGAVFHCGSMPIANPQYRSYPAWKPEPLPATKRDGNVEVTLEKFRTGLDENFQLERGAGGAETIIFGTNRSDPMNASACVLRLRSLTDTNEIWRVADAELSDATGNVVPIPRLRGDRRSHIYFSPALWPGEAAWKLKLDLLCETPLNPAAQFTFRNVPLGAVHSTNRVGRTTNCNGVTVTLEQIIRRVPPEAGSFTLQESLSQVCFKTSGLTNGLRLDCLLAFTEHGTGVGTGLWSIGQNSRTNYADIPAGAKTADFTFLVQHARHVEFLVKPEIGPLRIEIPAARPLRGQ